MKISQIIVLLLLLSCVDSKKEVDKKSNSILVNIKNNDQIILNGLYKGVQNGYYLKNKFGDDLVIQGNKVPIPPVDHKFLFEKNLNVSLQQTSSDGQRVYYEGKYQIILDNQSTTHFQCDLSDGEFSNPTLIIEYSKLNKNIIVKGKDGSPDFEIKSSN